MAYFKAKVSKSARKKSQDKVKKDAAVFSYKKMIVPFSVVLTAAVIFTGFYLLYLKSPYFIVTDLVLSGKVPGSTVEYGELEKMIVGENIFALKLGEIRSRMLESYPELADLKLSRAFPASVIAQIALRYPIAQIQQGSYYPVDYDRVLLSSVREAPDGNLPIISGVQVNVSRQVGKRTDSKRVATALLLLKEIGSSGILEDHRLVEIDVSSVRNAIFFLEGGLEVKIGHEDYAARLDNLRTVLLDRNINPSDIRYIDLRFKEPVIGTKWKR